MATSINSSGVTFPDGTTQTTAVSGTGVPSTLTGVGSTIGAYSSSSASTTTGSTVSGANLFYVNETMSNTGSPGAAAPYNVNKVNATASFNAPDYYNGTGTTRTWTSIGVGTWMNVDAKTLAGASYDACISATYFQYCTWRRIS